MESLALQLETANGYLVCLDTMQRAHDQMWRAAEMLLTQHRVAFSVNFILIVFDKMNNIKDNVRISSTFKFNGINDFYLSTEEKQQNNLKLYSQTMKTAVQLIQLTPIHTKDTNNASFHLTRTSHHTALCANESCASWGIVCIVLVRRHSVSRFCAALMEYVCFLQ